MKVCIYGGGREDLGAIRYEVEWITVKPAANHKECLDPDIDTDTYVEYFPDKDAAMKRGQEVYDTTQLCWGVVMVRKEIVDWFVEEDRIAEWRDAGDEDEISATNHYTDYLAAHTSPSAHSPSRKSN